MTGREKQLNEAVYNTALTALNAEKPQYAGTYEGQLNELFNKIQNREKFSYDVKADPLYQAYKDQYIQQGKLAMKDTMGQAAALTGGYGNTYGQQVGQQAYDAYLQKLSAAIPELYGMAYEKYKDEGDQMKDLYSLVGQQRDTEYGMYRDALGDWERGQAVLRDLEAQEYDRRMQAEAIAREQARWNWQKAWEEDQREYERNRYAEETAYKREQEAAAIQRDLERQAYERSRYEEQTAYEREKYEEEVGRKLEQQEYQRRIAEEQEAYDRQKYEEQISRQLEQQEYQRRMAEEQEAYDRQKYNEQVSRQMEQQEYQRQQDSYSNLMAVIKMTGYTPTDEELIRAGMSRNEADAVAGEFAYLRAQEELERDLAMERAAYGGSGGSSGGRSYGGGGGGYGGYDYDYDDYDYTPAASTGGLLSAGASKVAGMTVPTTKKTAGEIGWNDTSRMLKEMEIEKLTQKAQANPTRENIVAAANAAVNGGSARNAISLDEFKKTLNSLPKSR